MIYNLLMVSRNVYSTTSFASVTFSNLLLFQFCCSNKNYIKFFDFHSKKNQKKIVEKIVNRDLCETRFCMQTYEAYTVIHDKRFLHPM